MNKETIDSSDQESGLHEKFPPHVQIAAGALVCVLFGTLMGWAIHVLWKMDETQVAGTDSFKEQMMHRKTRTMEQILDSLVRGNMRSVEKSARKMESIGVHLNWYSSSELYEENDERFRQSTLDLIEAAQNRDHDAAKESALRLERSCIECHELINVQKNPNP
ncbi:MAG: hypothetical protein RIK87_10205 [Fuerstiella sp.]